MDSRPEKALSLWINGANSRAAMMAMDNAVRQTLKRLVEQKGKDIMLDARRCEGLLWPSPPPPSARLQRCFAHSKADALSASSKPNQSSALRPCTQTI